MKEKRGISLIVLIVTIIVMIIIAGAVIISLTETNIIDQAETATKNWNISTIKEQFNIKNALRQGGIEREHLSKVENGTLKELGIEGTNWDDKLLIQNSELVYRPEMVTQEEVTELTSMGINAGTYIGVVASDVSLANYTDTTNLITVDNLESTIVDNNYAIIYILEDVTLPSGYGNNHLHKFYGVIDGMNHIVSFEEFCPIVPVNYGILKNIILRGTVDCLIDSGMFTINNYGLIYNCHNEVKLEDGFLVAGMANINEGKIINCSNTADMIGSDRISGICIENYGVLYNCYNSGNIEVYGGGEPVAGITVYSDGKLKNCYNTGNITGYGVGYGIVYSSYEAGGIPKVENCYNLGTIETDHLTGGIGGNPIINCYSKDKGLVLTTKNSVKTNCDWIENLGATDAEQKAELLKRLNEGNSTTVWVEDTNNINDGYPILYWQAQ